MAEKPKVNEEFRRHLLNFVNSLIAMAPSRNYITQFLFIVKLNKNNVDYKIMEEAYPELVKDRFVRENISKAFGITFSDKVALEPRRYGDQLVDFISSAMKLFEDSEFRSRVSLLLKDEFPQGIPNLAEEWVEVRLKGLISEPSYGNSAYKALREILRRGRAKMEDLEVALNVDKGILIESLNLICLYGFLEKDYDGSYKPSGDLGKYSNVLERVAL